MNIRIKLFAALRDAAGCEQVLLPWKQGMTHRDILEDLKRNFQAMTSLWDCSFVAVNGSYAEAGRSLMPEDEVAVLPPVSGG